MLDSLFLVDPLHSLVMGVGVRVVTEEASSVIDDPAAAFVEAPEAAVVKVDVPEAVVDRFEADVLLQQSVADGHAVAMPADAAVAADAPHFEMAGILGREQPRRKRVGRWPIDGRRRTLLERFLRALLMVQRPPARETGLLRAARRGRWPRDLSFKRAMHAFVAGILFGVPRLDELRYDAELDPPDRQRRQPRQGPPRA